MDFDDEQVVVKPTAALPSESMLNWIRTLLGRQKTGTPVASATVTPMADYRMHDGFVAAAHEHADYIVASLLEGASEGHFSSNFLLPAARPGLMQQIATSIAERQCPTHRGTMAQSFLYVYLQAGRPVGFSWVLESENSGELELYLFGVSSECRGQGIGPKVLAETLAQFPAGTRFRARVYDASAAMRKMLMAAGFRKNYKQTYGMVHLSYVVTESDTGLPSKRIV